MFVCIARAAFRPNHRSYGTADIVSIAADMRRQHPHQLWAAWPLVEFTQPHSEYIKRVADSGISPLLFGKFKYDLGGRLSPVQYTYMTAKFLSVLDLHKYELRREQMGELIKVFDNMEELAKIRAQIAKVNGDKRIEQINLAMYCLTVAMDAEFKII